MASIEALFVGQNPSTGGVDRDPTFRLDSRDAAAIVVSAIGSVVVPIVAVGQRIVGSQHARKAIDQCNTIAPGVYAAMVGLPAEAARALSYRWSVPEKIASAVNSVEIGTEHALGGVVEAVLHRLNSTQKRPVQAPFRDPLNAALSTEHFQGDSNQEGTDV